MEQRSCAGYVITQSIKVKDTEFVLGENPKTGMCVTWHCKIGDNYFWGHYCENYYAALKDLCERSAQEVDYLASIGAIPPLSSRKARDRGHERGCRYPNIPLGEKSRTARFFAPAYSPSVPPAMAVLWSTEALPEMFYLP